MSLNQSRFEKNEPQFRKPVGGRSGSGSGGQQRPYAGGRGRGGVGTSAPPVSTSRSFKKTSIAQGGQSSGNVLPVNTLDSKTASGTRSVENGGHVHSTLHGVSNTASPAYIPKAVDISAQKSSQSLPKAPSSQSSSITADSTLPSTPAKGDGAKGFSLQFGSISPGFMNGMQVPARTSSAPPNLDEQKRDQARRDAARAVPAIPLPSAPKQELPRKDFSSTQQPVTQETHTESKTKIDVQSASTSLPTQAPKSSAAPPIAGIHMPLPYHQSTVPMQFGGPNPQIQSQGVPTSSLQMQMQMPLQIGNPSQVPQQVFVPGLQHHLMQRQGIMHQGHNLGYNPQLGRQLPHQLGNLAVNMSTQFNQQQAGKFGSTRKAVKITHPETHEELRLDNRNGGSSGSRSHHSGASQSQPLPSYTPTPPTGYYPNSYAAGSPFFPAQTSLPLTSTPLTASSEAPKCNYSGSQALPTMFMNQSVSNTFSTSKAGASTPGTPHSSSLVRVQDVQNTIPSAQSTSTSVTIKAAGGSAREKVTGSNVAEKVETPKLSNLAVKPADVRKDVDVNKDSSAQPESSIGSLKQNAPLPSSVAAETSAVVTSFSVPVVNPKELASVSTDVSAVKRETLTEFTSVRGFHKQPGGTGHFQPSDQVDEQSDSTLLQVLGDSSRVVASEAAEAKITPTSSGLREDISEAVQMSPVVAYSEQIDVRNVVLSAESSSHSTENYETQDLVNKAGRDQHAKQNDLSSQEGIRRESVVAREKGVYKELLGGLQTDKSLEAFDGIKKINQDGEFKQIGPLVGVIETSQRADESATSCYEGDKISTQTSSSEYGSSTISDSCSTSLGIADSLSCKEDASESSTSNHGITSVSGNLSESNLQQDREISENSRPSSSSGAASGSNKTSTEANKTKNNRGKKKWKEMLQKADALGTSDLYMAYKGAEEKKESVVATEFPFESSLKEMPADDKSEESTSKNKDEPSKLELDDWEDAADISMPKLESSGKEDCGGSLHEEEGVTAIKYSRDFLLTFSEQCMGLPLGFEITSDIADALMRVNVNASRGVHEYPSPGRIIDRPAGTARLDRLGNGAMDADRWSKLPGSHTSGRDPGIDLAYGSNLMGFRSGPGPNYGVLRNPRAQGPFQHAGGILSGPLHSLSFQGVQRNNSDADRWQRATNFNKGLMPVPQTPLQVMHKAEKKYEVGKVSDEEQAKQRRLKGILNKLTPQNFEKLFEQVKEVNIDNAVTLTGVISQIFDKALMEPTFCEMYANFCYHLASELPDLSVDNEKITFRRLLLNKCQDEFERGEREEEEANKVDGEGETEQSEERREDKRLKARRRMLGNIRLIGELYKKRMLTERIMHECIRKLLGKHQNPDEENIEALCKLMSTIGEMIDHPKGKEDIDAYFEIMGKLSNNMSLSSRVRFMLKDAIDLRKNKWQQRRKVEGPKKIEEVHRDAAQERQGQVGRLSRGPSMNPAMRRGQPLEFGPRGSMLTSPVGQGGGFRGMPSQFRGYGAQDTRMDERNAFESRTLSVPLPQRSSSDEPITLGPQGGLARGMAFRGQPPVSNSPLLDSSPSYFDHRRRIGGLNGQINTPLECGPYSSREEHFVSHAAESSGAPIAYDQSSSQELNASYMSRDSRNPDRNLDRPRPSALPVAQARISAVDNVSSVKVWPEERLRDMSIAAIKEYYSAKDEKEVALCIKDLNARSFYPAVVSIWVTDSFERKDMERDMLAKLLVKLTMPQEGIFSPSQLIEGFESVLTNLEDTVNDAPRAPEFLGRIFGKIITENVVPLNEVGRLLHEGGEEPGRLLEAGLAADVLGSVLEMIRSEKGKPMLNEIRASSDLRLEDFRPPDPVRSRKLEMFM